MTKQNAHLVQGLRTVDAAALVVGTVIGTGIFLKTAVMSQLLGGTIFVMLAWVVGGLLSYTGALCYSELGSRFPKAGGEYAYLREGYGDLVAFLYWWTRILIAGPGSIAAYGVGAATFLGGLFAIPGGAPRSLAAIAFVLFFTGLNCLTVKVSGRIQSALTALKLLLVLGIVFGVFAFGQTASIENFTAGMNAANWPGWSAFGTALIAALWAYDGWNNLPMVGSEVKNPQRALPIALGLGMLAVSITYLCANFAYFYALPFDQVVGASSSRNPQALPVATLAAKTFLGEAGIGVMSVVFAISALGAMHGSILSSARVPYAMAVDGFMMKRLAFVNPKTHSPVAAVLLEGLIACALALTGTFDQLTDAVVFSSWIFYALAAGSLFLFRARDRKTGSKPAFKTPGYPWLPAVFIAVSVCLLLNTLVANPTQSLLGLVTIALGVPVFFVLKKRKQAAG